MATLETQAIGWLSRQCPETKWALDLSNFDKSVAEDLKYLTELYKVMLGRSLGKAIIKLEEEKEKLNQLYNG